MIKRNISKLIKSKAFISRPLITLFRLLKLLFYDIFKIRKIVNIKHNNINFKFYYNPGLKLHSGGRGLYLFREKFEDLLEFGHKFINRNDNCIDGGANQGIYSLSFSSVVGENGKVVFVEPFNYCHQIIKENMLLNNFNNIILEKKVLFEKSKEIKYIDYSYGVGSASITKNFGKKNILETETITIDDISKKYNLNINFIKLDVEGAELHALNGSKITIEKYNPILCIECRDIELYSKIQNFLEKFKYKAWVFKNNDLIGFKNFTPKSNIFFLK